MGSEGWNTSPINKGSDSCSYSTWRREAFQYSKEAYKKDRDKLFSRACYARTRGNGFKLKVGRFRLDTRKTFFYSEGDEPVEQGACRGGRFPSLETFKVRLDGALSNLILLKMSILIAGDVEQ